MIHAAMEHKCLSPWKGAAAGGLVVFAWSAISWMALPLHERTVHPLPSGAAVAAYLAESVPGSGVYFLANDPVGRSTPKNPFIFLAYNTQGWGSMGVSMALGLLIQMAGAFFWTWILGKIPGLTFRNSALYGAMFGFCVGVLGAMPNWVWWKFPFSISFLDVLDAVIAWTAASIVIAKWCQAPVCRVELRRP